MPKYTRRTRRRKTLKRKQKGGFRVDIKKILIWKELVKAIKDLNKDFKPVGFKVDQEAPPGGLPRMDEYRNRIADITDAKPITVEKVGDHYRIVDGRHRFAQAVASGSQTVNVQLEN